MPNSLHRDAHILNFVLEHPWAITIPMLQVVAGIVSRHYAGETVDDATLQAALVKRDRLPQPSGGGGVAVIPVRGVIGPRLNMLSEMSGGTSFEALTNTVNDAAADKDIETIVLDIDSPGGTVAGATEFAYTLMGIRAKKTVIAQGQFTVGSAAYWAASAATKIYAAPSAMIGSIGVLAMHTEISKAMAQLGVAKTYISAGKYKAELSDVSPLSDEARGYLQAGVDEAYARFVSDVSKGRGASLATVRESYGQGRMLSADEALKAGMIDGIATLTETISHARTGKPLRASSTTADSVQDPAQASQGITQDRRRSARDEQQRQELALLGL